MNNIQRTKEATQSPNNKANAKLDDKANAKSSTNDQAIEKMTTDKTEKATPSEISEVKVYIHEQMNAFRAEMNSKFDKVDLKFAEMNSKFDKVDSKIDVLQQEMNKYFRWTVGIIITLFLATLAL